LKELVHLQDRYEKRGRGNRLVPPRKRKKREKRGERKKVNTIYRTAPHAREKKDSLGGQPGFQGMRKKKKRDDGDDRNDRGRIYRGEKRGRGKGNDVTMYHPTHSSMPTAKGEKKEDGVEIHHRR